MKNRGIKGETKAALLKGMHDGIPIGLGYLAVSFSLGITARNAGLNPFQAFLASLLCNASAGEYAGFTLIAASAPYLAVIIPPARHDRVICGIVLFCFAASAAATYLPALSGLSSGTRTIILTVAISAAAAILFPRKQEETAQ